MNESGAGDYQANKYTTYVYSRIKHKIQSTNSNFFRKTCRKNKILRCVILSFIIPTFEILPPKSCWEEPQISANFCKDVNGRHLDLFLGDTTGDGYISFYKFQTKVSPRIDMEWHGWIFVVTYHKVFSLWPFMRDHPQFHHDLDLKDSLHIFFFDVTRFTSTSLTWRATPILMQQGDITQLGCHVNCAEIGWPSDTIPTCVRWRSLDIEHSTHFVTPTLLAGKNSFASAENFGENWGIEQGPVGFCLRWPWL